MITAIGAVFFRTILPVFGISLIGYLFAGRFKIDVRSLNRTAYYFFVPAFVFNTFANGNSIVGHIGSVLPAVFIIHLAVTAVTAGVSKLMGNDIRMTSAYVIAVAFPNIGNFAIPLLIFRFGETILQSAALLFLIILIHAFAVSVFFAGRESGIIKGLVSVAKTPAILAFFAALGVQFIGVEVPLPVLRLSGLMGDAMVPVMLFTIGAQIAGIRPLRFDRDVLVIVLLRLIVSPLIAWLLLQFFPLNEELFKTALIDYAMPVALLANIIATEYGVKPATVTMAVFFSTLGSVITLTLLLALV